MDNDSSIQKKVIDSIREACNDSDQAKAILFKFVGHDHNFPIKKTQTQNATPSINGILKSNWLHKHHALLPSAVILIFEFGLNCSAEEWSKVEICICDMYAKVRSQVGGRETKVLVAMVRAGPETIEKEELEERYTAFKKRMAIDSKVIPFIC